MIDQTKLRSYIEKVLEGTDCFLVDLKVKQGNEIEVVIDSDSPVGIEECERLTRSIESEFDRDVEDYVLEVGSAGLTSPLQTRRQYQKYLGQEVEVLPKEGKKITGLLKDAGEETFTVESTEKVKKPELKRPVLEKVDHTFGYDEVKYTKYLLKF